MVLSDPRTVRSFHPGREPELSRLISTAVMGPTSAPSTENSSVLKKKPEVSQGRLNVKGLSHWDYAPLWSKLRF